MDRIIEIQTPFGRDLSFVSLQGHEGLSELYEFKLTLTSKNPNLDAKKIIGQRATVLIETNAGNRPLNGLVTDFGYQAEDHDEEEYHLYTAILRPNLWYLTQRYDSRVFVDKDIIEISSTLLGELGVPFEIQCQNGYRKYGHSTQYQESTFNYLSRLFEQEGIYYYFKHSEGNNTLILVDDKSLHEPIQGRSNLPFHSIARPGTPHQSYIDDWQQMDHLATKKVDVNDYNYQKSKSQLTSSGPTHDLGGISTEHYDFYTSFNDNGDAPHYKQIRAQDYNARSKRIHAKGNVLTIAPGYTFKLSRHPHNAANTEHLILQANYDFREAGYTSGKEMSHYRIDFVVLPANIQYRTPRQTPKPQIIGTQAATVTGPAGEEVHTNEYGDIKVQFHWDRYGPKNEKSSDWIRVAQGSAGQNFGSINTPRIGEEVLVDFINGDSDRPIVIGRLYNSARRPPWGFPEAAMQSGIKSKSFNSPLENFNELMFNDTPMQELVNFQAQKDLTSLIKNDETRTVNNDRTTTIDNDETVTVHGKRTETVDKDETITIHQNRTETVDQNETISIGANRTETVTGNETISISGNRTETVTGNETISITGNRTESVTGNEKVDVTGNQNITVSQSKSEAVTQDRSITVSQNQTNSVSLEHTHNVGQNMTQSIGQNYNLSSGQNTTVNVGAACTFIVSDSFTVQVGSSILTMDSGGNITLQGANINIDGSSNVHTTAPDVNIN